MGVREDTLDLLQQGNTPGQIAKRMGVSIKTTLAYLDQMVGEGRVRRSDILLTIPAHHRRRPVNTDDNMVVEKYGQVFHLLGEIYEDVRFIETVLHAHIRKTLERYLGRGEKEWWMKGIPENTRKDCQVRREEDVARLDPYCYTDLIDLRIIIDKQWVILGPTLPLSSVRIKNNYWMIYGESIRCVEW